MSVEPKRDSKIYALLVTTWSADQEPDVTSIASSKVIAMSNVPVLATAASVNPIDTGVAEPKTSAKLLIQTNTSGCAALLSLPEAARPGVKPHPPSTAMAFSLAPDDPAAFESTGRNLGRLSADVLDPHNGILFLLLFFKNMFLSIYVI
jgi:hypothetical protein